MAKKDSLPQLYPPSSSLKAALAQYPAGTWVALSEDQHRIVGSGKTALKAERQAAAAGHRTNVLMQVPDRGSDGKSGRNGDGHSAKMSMPLNLPSFYRGIYKRVASRLGCDPSYVSRVARGERTSETVSQALQSELGHAMALTNRNGGRLLRGHV